MSTIGSPAVAMRCTSRPRSSLVTRYRAATNSMVCGPRITYEIANEGMSCVLWWFFALSRNRTRHARGDRR